MTGDAHGRRDAEAVAALVFAAAAPLLYVSLRFVERLRYGPPRVLAMASSAHVSFYWRCATSLYLSLLLAVIARALVSRGGDPQRAARRLRRALPPAALLVLALAWLLP